MDGWSGVAWLEMDTAGAAATGSPTPRVLGQLAMTRWVQQQKQSSFLSVALELDESPSSHAVTAMRSQATRSTPVYRRSNSAAVRTSAGNKRIAALMIAQAGEAV